jgi:hypothetical protein
VEPAIEAMSIVRARGHALPARYALDREKAYVGSGFHGFWIVAPRATQGTSFEKNRGADTGTIMNGKSLNVKYAPGD